MNEPNEQEMTLTWGMMASGIMFRHNGRVFLQLRSKYVAQGGTWGVPGGALKGTDGWYYSRPGTPEEKIQVLEDHPEIVDTVYSRMGVDLFQYPDRIPTLEDRPSLDEDDLIRLWNSALAEVREELGFVPRLSQDQYAKSQKVVNWNGNFPYVTFVVDVTDDQARDLLGESKLTDESDGHDWYDSSEMPKDTHKGVKYVMERLNSSLDVSRVMLSTEFPPGIQVVAKERWTQNQVYDDGEKVYDVEVLKRVIEGNRVEKVKVSDLVEQLYDKEVWAEGDRLLSPIMVLTNPTYDHLTIMHMTRIRTSNPQNPIIIRFKNGRIVDGYHRVTKAFIRGDSKINAIFAQEEQMARAVFKD